MSQMLVVAGEQHRWEKITTQARDGVEIVPDLPGRGRGVKVTRTFAVNKVVCDYGGRLLSHKEGKDKYEQSPENAMGYMFSFRHKGTAFWWDATEEVPGPGRLINHSRCHPNVSICNY